MPVSFWVNEISNCGRCWYICQSLRAWNASATNRGHEAVNRCRQEVWRRANCATVYKWGTTKRFKYTVKAQADLRFNVTSFAYVRDGMEGTTVLLTGVTGYVGSELARQLLEAGAHLRCPVRCPLDSPRLASLKKAFDGLPGTITFLDADIRSEEAIAAAAAGCTYVFHVASPFVITADDPARDIVAPAVEGTAAVLRGAARHKGNALRRVVVTSSVCAIHDCSAKQQPQAGAGKPYTEEDWNEVSTVEAEPYWVSKVEAERTAWRLADELGLEVVTVLPNFVMGPVAATDAAAGISVGFFRSFVEARDGADPKPPPSGSWTFTDVRDVAAAHVLAALTPAAAGRRYIVSQPKSVSAKSVTDVLKGSVPQLAHLPDGAEGPEEEKIDASRVVRELGLQYTPLERTLTDMAESLIKLHLAVPATPAAAVAAAVPS